ncbi:cupin domain-containing protein [Pedobacter aquatilis]|uniref:cupin domain-containing protein n=1 Tax=Pedobacter aquatilis TaxID=351343 RepID=UPI002930ABF0|nr:cupin domain-containing protein [Pedobacter aquatilis]
MKNSSNSIFPIGEKITNGYFTGEAYLQLLAERDENNDFVLGSLTFMPGARTNWHSHPKGQILMVTEGEGLYQERGKTAQRIKKGDIIKIPANVDHWHGAVSGAKMSHIALTNFKDDTNAIWLLPVSEDEYKQANQD